jgi:hypothetical protein
MSHTKRRYNKHLVYKGIWQPYHPYKQLVMKCNCSLCKSRRKYLNAKRNRLANKRALQVHIQLESQPVPNWCELEYDPLSGLYDVYLEYIQWEEDKHSNYDYEY